MEWKVIKPDVFAAIMDFFTSGLPVVNEDSQPNADTGWHIYLQIREKHQYFKCKIFIMQNNLCLFSTI